MKFILKRLLKGVLVLVSFMPFPLLYAFSSFLSFMLLYVLGYRKKVVTQNLKNAFPDLNNNEILKIRKKYYRNLSDFMLETIKLNAITKKQLANRMEVEGLDILYKYHEEGKSVFAVLGHCPNWEWMGVQVAYLSKFKVYGVVKPLSDPYFNKFFFAIRERFSPNSLLPFKMTLRTVVLNQKNPSTYLIAVDQTPTKSEIEYWTKFMNQDTPVFLGPEKMSIRFNYPVVFVRMERKKRGYYKATFEELVSNPAATKEFDITEAHVGRLDKHIRKYPDNWLWSHRRWKHRK